MNRLGMRVVFVLAGLCSSTQASAQVAGIVGVGPNSCNYPTVQDAIDAASPGDVVLVWGTTIFPPDTIGVTKDLYLGAGNNTCTTLTGTVTLDASGHGGRTMKVTGATTELYTWGVSLVNGVEGEGGNLLVEDAEVHFYRGRMASGVASSRGGNAYVKDGRLDLAYEAYVEFGEAPNGGGIYVEDGDLTFFRAAIRENHASEDGGGVYLLGDDEVATMNCGGVDAEVLLNEADRHGGGIAGVGYVQVGTVENPTEMLIEGNEAEEEGGGIYFAAETTPSGAPSSATFVRVKGNDAYVGGGVASDHRAGSQTVLVQQSVIEENTSKNGAGIFVDMIGGRDVGDSFTADNVWIMNNVAGSSGGGLYQESGRVVIEATWTDFTGPFAPVDVYPTQIVGNTADYAAGVEAYDALEMYRVYMADQVVAPSFGLYAPVDVVVHGDAHLSNVLIHSTGSGPSIRAQYGAQLDIDHLTLEAQYDPHVEYQGGTSGSLTASIVTGDVEFGAVAYDAFCSLITGSISYGGGGSANLAGACVGSGCDPDFTTGVFSTSELGASSDAIGICAGFSSLSEDLVAEPRTSQDAGALAW